MPRHGHQLAGGVPHSPHFLQHGATRRPARAVTVAHASSPHSILPRGQGAHAQWHSAPCVVAGPPLRRCRCLGSGITSELLLNSHGIAAHQRASAAHSLCCSFYSGNSGHSGADLVAPLRKHFRGPMYTGNQTLLFRGAEFAPGRGMWNGQVWAPLANCSQLLQRARILLKNYDVMALFKRQATPRPDSRTSNFRPLVASWLRKAHMEPIHVRIIALPGRLWPR